MKKRKKEKDKSAAQVYLEQIERLKIQIDRKKDKAERLYCLATKSTAAMNASGAAGGGNPDKMGGVADGHMDLENEIKQDKQRLERMIGEAFDILAHLKDEKHYDVLKDRYLYFIPFTQIAVNEKCTYRGICIRHGRALQEFGKVLEEHKQTNDKFTREIAARYGT